MNNNNSLRSQIEALLFSSGDPVEVEKLAKFLKIGKEACEREIDNLENFYYENNSGLAIVKIKDSVQLVSNKNQAENIAKFFNRQLHEELSQSALEVLAVAAYRGPLTRAAIEQIRGVNCSFTLRNLAIRGLIERKENPSDSRAYLYEITADCLKSLGISQLKNLPNYDILNKV